MKIQLHSSFHTPTSQQEIFDWIALHEDTDDRIHLVTVMMMTWNYLASQVNEEEASEMNYDTKLMYRIGDNPSKHKHTTLGLFIDHNEFTTTELIYLFNQLANGREATFGGGAAPISRVWLNKEKEDGSQAQEMEDSQR